ncbi:hypothetical protein Rmf_48860 [Roseomonas fluvialis]|uniref:Uncharacterized protein n=2 Tax=Roseomonas fluvialis TaxID=1750527 RepID=A0ABM7YA54_9PROT|nr:hypothetical protein Rmf_48860 [Roseomonas fluvialis]
MPQHGDVLVRPKTGTTLFAGGAAEALIRTATGLQPLTAKISVDTARLYVQVRVSSGDLAGLPHPTGNLEVEDPVTGWQGSVSIS